MKKILLASLLMFGMVSGLSAKEDMSEEIVSCVKQDALACFKVGMHYMNGDGGDKDYETGTDFLDLACDYGQKEACPVVESFKNDLKILEKEIEKCNSGDAKYCFKVAMLYDKGGVLRDDIETANKYYKKGCDGDYIKACVNLGINYIDSDIETASREKQRETLKIFTKACDAGNKTGCEGKKMVEDILNAERE